MRHHRPIALRGLRVFAALAIVLGVAFAVFVADSLLERLHRLGGYAPRTIVLLSIMILAPVLAVGTAMIFASVRRKSPWPELALIATAPAQLFAIYLHLK